MSRILLVPLLFFIPPFTPAALAQVSAPEVERQELFVFLDCNGRHCDFDHFRREIGWINWVRDREDADLHLLVTSQRTGGGGQHYTLDFLGSRSFEGTRKSRSYISDPDDTDAEVREGLTQVMALGLVQFAETTPLAPNLRVVYESPEAEVLPGLEQDDPWNLWVFRLGAEGSLDGESQERGYSIEGNANADRVAEDVKINIGLSAEYDHEEFDELEEGETFVNTSEDYTAGALVVWSLSDRWSLGGTTEANKSTFYNLDLGVSIGPELETVEGKTEEVLPRHTLLVAAAVQQPWGEIFGAVEGIQYLHDLSTHRINTDLNVEYRLFRGFSLDVSAEFSRIKDQFFLPAEDLTPEEILVRRRQRETNYQFDLNLGFSYRFGSKFANIVNPRMSERDHH
jgi:hypothetical protein